MQCCISDGTFKGATIFMKIKSAMLLLLASIFLFPNQVEAARDFRVKDYDEAVDEIINEFEQFRDELTEREENTLRIFESNINKASTETDPHLNYLLRVTGGHLDSLPRGLTPEEILKISTIKSENETLEELFRRENGRVKEGLFLYSSLSSSDFFIPESTFYTRDNPNLLLEDRVRHLRDNLKYGISSDFLTGSPAGDEPQAAGFLKYRIRIPTNTHLVHLNSAMDYLVVDKGTGIEVKSIRISTEKGRQIVIVEADLVSKESIDSGIADISSNINEKIVDKMGNEKFSDIFKLDLTGRGASLIAEQATDTVNKFLELVPKKLLDEGLEFMQEKEGKIIFVDRLLGYVDEAIPAGLTISETQETVNRINKSAGRYNLNKRMLVINGHASGAAGKEMDSDRLLHEFGHVIDNMKGVSASYEGELISGTSEFQEIYNEEKNNLNEYAASNKEEFFAEAFRFFYSDNEANKSLLREQAPKAYEFMKSL